MSFTLGDRYLSATPGRHQPPGSSGTRLKRDAAPIPLALLASDPMTEDCAIAYLSQSPPLRLLSRDQSSKAEAVLVLASNVTGDTLTSIEGIVREASGATPSVVLVADSISRSHLVRAISHGLVSFLPRPQAGMERVVQAVLATRAGHADLPQPMVKALIEQIRSGDDGQTGTDPGSAGLNRREINVLSLIADGLSTSEIAQQLNYSEKTIKNILHSMTVRVGLRNRAHAVAYAIRAGIV
ncbi:response regulator transcription factor [Streptomyces mirabilis]|uniref:response regulator transcription factor n=1 Tax=Streptomyces mirabilis TaxID=68239 RepID=UPI00368EB40F